MGNQFMTPIYHNTLNKTEDFELQRFTQQPAGRVRELEERYADTMPVLEQEVDSLSSNVEIHLSRWD